MKLHCVRTLCCCLAGQSFYFVFVLAGDMEETERLDQQVDALCQQLRQHRVPYVVIKSTSDLPVVDLPPHIRDTLPTFPTEVTSQSYYVSQCFKKVRITVFSVCVCVCVCLCVCTCVHVCVPACPISSWIDVSSLYCF